MIEGLYRIVVTLSGNPIPGVAVLVGGRIYGGGEAVAFEGTYKCEGNEVEIAAKAFIHDAGYSGSFRQLDPSTLMLKGRSDGQRTSLSGSIQTHILKKPNVKAELYKLNAAAYF